ncbi:MAG: hypothetical protein ACK5AZ_02890 [Bryobacteraceae bacterium]
MTEKTSSGARRFNRAESASSESPSEGSVLAELRKILASRAFVHSERLCRFLQYIVEQALRGEDSKLKEYSIGVEVFDRTESFDPRIDSIVRVEARRLRAKLSQYYETEGAEDEVLIQFKKGSYVPYFRVRERAEEQAQERVQDAERKWTAVAVLPFAPGSDGPAETSFAEGLTQEIINALARVAGFRVVSRTSSWQFRERDQDLRRIGGELRADSVLHGWVRLSSERIRVAANLMEVQAGVYSWSKVFERPTGEPFALQEEIARAVSAELAARLAPEQAGRQEHPSPAFVHSSRAWHCLRQFQPGALRRARRLFEQALHADGRDASSLIGLSRTLSTLALWGEPETEGLDRLALAAAEAAAATGSAEGHAALGAARLLCGWDWEGAGRSIERALEMDPNASAGLLWRGVALACRGELEGALTELDRAWARNPASIEIAWHRLAVLSRLERWPAVRSLSGAILEMEPQCWVGHLGEALARLRDGDPAGAIESIECGCANYEGTMLQGTMGYIAGATGDRAKAEFILAGLGPPSIQGHTLEAAAIHAGLGAPASALLCLNRALAMRIPRLALLEVLPEAAPLRQDRRYVEVHARILGR